MTEAQAKKRDKEIHAQTVGTFSTPIGEKYLARLIEVYIDRKIYIQGDRIEQTAYRQGGADLVKQILTEMNRR